MAMVIKFEKGGKVTMTPTGYPGEACARMTSHYRKHMAGDRRSETPTAEMYEPEETQALPAQKHTEEA